MADFKACSNYNIHDDYYTPKWIFERFNEFIPKNVKIWEMCLLDSNGQSKKYLEELGHDVMGDTKCDCLQQTDYEDICDMIITNPPYDKKLKIPILQKLAKLDKPFMLLMNSTNIHSNYFQDIFKGKDIFFLIPKQKLYYDKYNGTKLITHHTKNKSTSYYSFIICYKVLTKNHFI